MNRIIELNNKELRICRLIATARHEEFKVRGYISKNRLLKSQTPVGWHTIGVCGEMAFAKWLDVEYTADVNSFHDKRDVGPFEVRTVSKDFYGLILRKTDKEIADNPFALVIKQTSNRYRVVGWMNGKDVFKNGRLDDFGIKTRAPVHTMPQSDLNKDFSCFDKELKKLSKPFKISLPTIVRKYRSHVTTCSK